MKVVSFKIRFFFFEKINIFFIEKINNFIDSN